MNDFAGLSAVVTGGAAGIGLACALELHDRGAHVVVLDQRVDDLPDGLTGLAVDVADVVAVTAAVSSLRELDVLVNNAGVSFVGGVEDGDLADDWHRLWDVNVLGYVRVIRAALPLLRRSSQASIVNMSSCTATSGLAQRVLYSATKGAVEAMSRAMANDLLAEGIRVNCVAPGTVDTPFMAELAARTTDPGATRALFDSRQPTGHMVHPLEVAAAVCYLAHPSSRSTVGSVLTVDGGLTPVRRFT
jgi:2-keto-3-deoxy-L-fuconate dehydrogenase